MYIPGFGDVSTPERAAETLARNPGTAATERARSGVLGPLANPNQGSGVQGLTDRPDPRDMPDPGPQPSTAGVTQQTFTYPSVLPPLSPEAQRAFAERRRAATAAEEQARAQIDRQRQQAEAAAVQGRRQIGEEQQRQSLAGMEELAGRGVARSPMFVNPFQRGVARQAQQRVGELESGLAQTLENLGAALQRAQSERARELADIEMDIMAARSNVPRLLGVG